MTEELCKTKDGVINVNMDDDAIRGLTVIKSGDITWPPPAPKIPAAAAKPAAAKPAVAEKKGGHGHGGGGQSSASQLAVTAGIGAAVFLLLGLYAPAAFIGHFTVFALACFVGYMVVWNVTPALHTPLMSVTNAISSIIAIGALVQIAPPLAAGCIPHRQSHRHSRDRQHRANRNQHVRRLRGDAAHAGDVPQVRRRICFPIASFRSPISAPRSCSS